MSNQEEMARCLARVSAAEFASEFPGELMLGDWDAEAWAVDGQVFPADERDSLWEIYSVELCAEVAQLAKERVS